MTQWLIDVKEQRIFSRGKIFTASKASQWNLWSFIVPAKILVGAKIICTRNDFALTDFFGKSNKILRSENRPLGKKFGEVSGTLEASENKNINFLLTEREGRTGEYWPEVVAVRSVRTKRPRANIPRYGSS